MKIKVRAVFCLVLFISVLFSILFYFIINGGDRMNNVEPDDILLLKSIKKDDLINIEKLVKKGVDLNRVSNMINPLIYAIHLKKLESFKLLIKSGADVNAILDNETSVLNEAIYSGNIEFLKTCINNGGDVNLLHPLGGRPLFYALEKDNFSAADYLLKNGANINLADKFHVTTFSYLLVRRNFTGCLFLIKKGFAPDKSDKELTKSIVHFIETAHKVRDMKQIKFKDFFLLIKELENLGYKFELKEL